ncbi:MAG: hypothetical protein AB7F35_20705 [Acetobacteraceae bacterium]
MQPGVNDRASGDGGTSDRLTRLDNGIALRTAESKEVVPCWTRAVLITAGVFPVVKTHVADGTVVMRSCGQRKGGHPLLQMGIVSFVFSDTIAFGRPAWAP